MVANIVNEKERLHRSHFPDSGGKMFMWNSEHSGGPPDFVLPGNVEFALMSKIVYRESLPSLSENLKRLY